jgi:hypothetical protein
MVIKHFALKSDPKTVIAIFAPKSDHKWAQKICTKSDSKKVIKNFALKSDF